MDEAHEAPRREEISGFVIHRGLLSAAARARLVDEVFAVAEVAPFYAPTTPWGKPMSVRMTSAGRFGWYTDRRGYRYIERHPLTGEPWPPIPPGALAVWEAVSGCARAPECCLVNLYRGKARMGLHRDADERDYDAPVVSISLGDPGLFRMGGAARRDPTSSTWLASGDVVVMGGAARRAFHGVDRIREGEGDLPGGGRINLTLRVVT